MIIRQIELEKANGLLTAQAYLHFEASDASPFVLFVQVPEDFENFFKADSNAFLLGAAIAAWGRGEKRIRVEGSICPQFKANLRGAFMMLKSWYPNELGPIPTIESPAGTRSVTPKNQRTISLMSGGIDSLCLLRSNHLNYSPDHPAYIKAVLTISMGKKPVINRTEFNDQFAGRMTSVQVVADEENVTVIPALTNIYYLNPDGYFYGQKSYASQLSALLSFFSGGFSHGMIASSYDASYHAKPWGSSPQLDTYFSSGHFRIENVGSELTRLDKVNIVADWPAGYRSIRVCQNDNSGGSNCGTCEKCIRTKLMLESLGKLKGCPSFPDDTMDLDLLEYLITYNMLTSDDPLHNEEKVYQYGLAIPFLIERGRSDLAERLQEILEGLLV